MKLSVSEIVDYGEIVSAASQRANVGDMKKINNCIDPRSFESTVSMLTFFAALRQKMANFSSLKLSVTAIIDDSETVGADLQRAHIGDMKKINNNVNPMNLQ